MAVGPCVLSVRKKQANLARVCDSVHPRTRLDDSSNLLGPSEAMKTYECGIVKIPLQHFSPPPLSLSRSLRQTCQYSQVTRSMSSIYVVPSLLRYPRVDSLFYLHLESYRRRRRRRRFSVSTKNIAGTTTASVRRTNRLLRRASSQPC